MPVRKTPLTKEKALDRLMGLCSRSEQCESDLVRKLYSWGISSTAQKEIIDYLKEHRYLDDTRFASCYAKDKARFSSWGPLKIKAELYKRKIKPATIKQALETVDGAIWKEGILKCAQAKAKNLDLSGEEAFENRQKLLRYLISRGFPSSFSLKAISFVIRSSK